MGGFARTGSRCFSNLRAGKTARDGRGGTCILCTSSLLVPNPLQDLHRAGSRPADVPPAFGPRGRRKVETARSGCAPLGCPFFGRDHRSGCDWIVGPGLLLQSSPRRALLRSFKVQGRRPRDRLCSLVGFRGGRPAWVHHRCAALRRRVSLVLLVQDEHH